MKSKVALFSFTENGKKICDKIKKSFDYDFYEESTPSLVKAFVKENFNEFDAHIFVGAIGIAVRFIKDNINSKDKDPAVIVLDEKGKFVIPILSGHLGGANELAVRISQKLNSTPVITTATDINQKFAVDIFAKENNLSIANVEEIKSISAQILADNGINFASEFKVVGELPFILDEYANIGICISEEVKKPFENTLNLIPKNINIGVGCKKNTDSSHFEEYVLNTLKAVGLSVLNVGSIASIDIKSDEKAIRDFARKYKIKANFYSADMLSALKGDFTKSDFVKSITGVDNVCERSAIISDENSELILKKQSKNGITIALAKKEWSCTF